ncbi:hypothetical protein J0H58_08785 [bacterium]|nr:hypothetical protein [bacterium]
MSTTTCPTCRATIDVAEHTRDGTVQCGKCGREFAPPEPGPAAESPPAEAAPPRQFPVIPFQASRGGPALGLGLAAFMGLVAALLFGVGAALLRTALWLVLVFPLLHGVIVGAFAGLGARITKARYQGGVAVVAAGCGLVSYMVVHYLFYLSFLGGLPAGAPQVGFWEYMDLRATEGVRFGKPGQNAGGGIGYVGSVIYWALEAIVTMAGAAGVAVVTIGSPFCEQCNRWKSKRTMGPYTVEPAYAVPAVGGGLPAGMLAPAEAGRSVTVEISYCPHCKDAGTLDVKVSGAAKVGKNMQFSNAYVTYPGEALATFNEVETTLRELGLGGKKK